MIQIKKGKVFCEKCNKTTDCTARRADDNSCLIWYCTICGREVSKSLIKII